MVNKWVSKASGYSPIMSEPSSSSKKLIDLNPSTVVEIVGEIVNGFDNVKYIYSDGKIYVGWMDARYLDPYIENYAKNCVDISDIATSNPNDAQQYVMWNGKTQYNMCGELCVCYILGIPKLSTFLNDWKVKDPSTYNRIFGSGVASGTSETDLVSMIEMYGYDSSTLSSTYKQYTPNLLTVSLTGSIVGTRINTSNGRLNGGGAGHWVVVTGNLQERCGYGSTRIYNPFPNRIEAYSYSEFRASANVPYGAKKYEV